MSGQRNGHSGLKGSLMRAADRVGAGDPLRAQEFSGVSLLLTSATLAIIPLRACSSRAAPVIHTL